MKSPFSISFLFILILVSVLLVSCNDEESLSKAATMIVSEKGYDEAEEVYWIQAYNPNEQTEEEAERIFMDNPSIWNLIIPREQYVITAETEESNSWNLIYIEPLSGDSTPSN
ncbi:hypothetical protein [Planomicrobium sp. Y74]|uniref:hypothetical protein n=1 Tax=Planomicrobium sp. Y74 TaxID=2478977 RepID=UPI000EF4DEED|nr:hypothetical protein [Planomicrobium sp. Y74]RLQ89714.1 hypothetical protein D9754_13000 [Planomicrobium sp. Y74]